MHVGVGRKGEQWVTGDWAWYGGEGGKESSFLSHHQHHGQLSVRKEDRLELFHCVDRHHQLLRQVLH